MDSNSNSNRRNSKSGEQVDKQHSVEVCGGDTRSDGNDIRNDACGIRIRRRCCESRNMCHYQLHSVAREVHC